MTLLTQFASLVQGLSRHVESLEATVQRLQLPVAGQNHWQELLTRKLLPQLSEEAWLVVAVVGGTNIGKSVVFNHLARDRISASSPLASGTKHPVLICPPGFAQSHDLNTLFPDFRLVEWDTPEQSLQATDQHCLFWRESSQTPRNLLLLDTPDIDSDAPINWERANAVRQSADVLVAILTQQKYNDAAVKQFFRKAALEDKVLVIVFNRLDLPEDEEWWPKWLGTFCEETGAKPEYLFLAPNDRKAADQLSLPFYERSLSGANSESPSDQPVELPEVLSRLRFGEIKLQTLRGSLNRLIAADGVPGWLQEISNHSQDYRQATELLVTNQLAEVRDWPTLPNSVLLEEIKSWWTTHRTGWSAKVHRFYDTMGGALLTPVRYAHTWLQGPVTSPIERYRHQEWAAIVETVQNLYQKLDWLAKLGHPLLTARLSSLLAGASRAELLAKWDREHASLDFQSLTHDVVTRELATFREESPQFYQFFKQLDVAAAAGRPALTIVLGLTGVGLPFGEAATHLASTALMQTALHVAGDVVGGATVATVGETAISSTASNTTGFLQAKFRKLQEAFAASRTQWLAERLERDLLGNLTQELQAAAGVVVSEEFLSVQKVVEELRQKLQATV